LWVYYTPSPVVDAGEDMYLCKGDSVELHGIVSGGASFGNWSSSGTGFFIPNDSSLDVIYVPSEDDTVAGSIIITLTSTNNGSCNSVSDYIYVVFTDPPFVDAGADITICEGTEANLSGIVSGVSTTGLWSSSGTGTFIPNNASLSATYIPSMADVQNGQVTLTLVSTYSCPVSDELILTIIPKPIVNAGSDTIICVDVNQVQLNGQVSGSTTTGIWTTLGTGTFIPDPTTLNATYMLSQADSLMGSVSLVLTSTNNGVCEAQSDTLNIFITPIPSVIAGNDTSVCANNVLVLSGQIIGTPGTGYWTSTGNGTFVPNKYDLNATYLFSPDDTLAGTITLTLHATGACIPVSNSFIVTITHAPFVEAGPDISVCANNPNATLQGMAWGATQTAHWSTSGDGYFIPSPDDLNATYVPGSQDLLNDSVYLYLEATNIGNCLPVKDSVLLIIYKPPVVEAGNVMYICNDEYAALHGTVNSSFNTGYWQTLGDGTFSPSNDVLNAIYYPGTSDIANGTVLLVLTSTNNGDCLPVSDTLTLYITLRPNVFAGNDDSLCSNSIIVLNGYISGSTNNGFWTTLGDGVFSPDSSLLDATYIPGALDLQNGYVNLILTSVNACSVSDTVTYYFVEPPTVDAGNDQSICYGVNSINFSGNVNNASYYYWTTSGSGIFEPNNLSLNGTYILSDEDTLHGTVILTLVAFGSPLCDSVYDQLTITTQNQFYVNAGEDLTICASDELYLSGITNADSVYWTSSGTGSFIPDSTSLNVQYQFSNQDVANGNVYLILHAVTNCGILHDTMEVSITPLPIVNAGVNRILCKNADTISLSGVVVNTYSSGIWTTNGTGTFVPSDTALNVVYYFSQEDLNNENLIFWLTSTNNGVCSPVTDSMTVEFESPAVVFAGNDFNVCLGASAELNGQINGGTGSGYWTTTGDGTFIPSADSLNTTYMPGVNDLSLASVTLILTSNSTGICSSVSDSLIVTFLSGNSAINIPDEMSICYGDSLFIIPTITGDTGQFVWTTNGFGQFIPDSTAINPIYLPSLQDLEFGTIQIYLNYTYLCGNVHDTMQLTINRKPNAQIYYLTNCNNYQVDFIDSTVVQNGHIAQWNWNFGDGETSSQQNVSHQYANIGQYLVSLQVTTDVGCTDSVEKWITIYPIVNAQFSVSDSTSGIGELIQFNNQSVNATSYNWNFGDNIGTSVLENPTYSYSAPGTYPVWLYAYGINNCVDSVMHNIYVKYSGYAIPTAFSPNGDGKNDILFVRGGPFVSYEMRIFNNWGQEIFYSNNQAIGWDGTYKNKEVQEGVYVLIFKGKMLDGTEINYVGDVTLIR